MPSVNFETLHESIWLRILELLVPAQPKPLSGWTQAEMPRDLFEVSKTLPTLGAPGTTGREDIRADALAKLMRTSSSFNRLAARHLYKRIMTDDLGLLVRNYTAPRSHPSIRSKRELLEMTTHLGLEYRRKVADPSYIQTMIDPTFWTVTGSLDAMTGMTLEADIEAKVHLAALEELSQQMPFPQLSHLSFGAVFGGQDELWQLVSNSTSPTPLSKRVERCLRLNVGLFSNSPIRQFCVRGAFGMLALPPMVLWPEIASKASPPITPSFTFHYLIAFPQPSLTLSHPTRYILETRDRTHSYRTVDCSTFKLVTATMWERRQHPRGVSRPINLEIFGSSQRLRVGEVHVSLPAAPPVDVGLQRRDEQERASVQELQEDAIDYIKKTEGWPHRKDDRLVIKPWIDAGPCDACGWSVDREGNGDRGQQVYDLETKVGRRSHRHCPGGGW